MALSVEVGLAALNAFLQANVTGPILADEQANLSTPYARSSEVDLCPSTLDVDGVSVYPFIPHIELFCLARHVLLNASPEAWAAYSGSVGAGDEAGISLAWARLRVNVWHYKLFIQPSLASGSVFTRHAGMSEVPSLVEAITAGLDQVESDVLGQAWEVLSSDSKWDIEAKVRFLLEKANVCIMLGRDLAAREALGSAAELSGLVYALSGALGKRTRFQEKSTSQLVVLARSTFVGVDGDAKQQDAPKALPLNDDTLLEKIDYSEHGDGLSGEQEASGSLLPAALRGLKPDEQPQLSSLDQIVLLTEATLKDAFSPADTLTSEEILPFAVRVISDKTTNWQIYTQALLVRSRIEMHRSRTVERGVLQMQAVVDQVVVDTTEEKQSDDKKQEVQQDVPSISLTGPGANENASPAREREEAAPVDDAKPKSFFPATKAADSAPAHARLEYIHALSSPPRWHLESELAYAWTGVGSLVSALEIFKRLRLWAEVALCLASSAAADNEDGSGRGGGGEEKARAVVRWRLFHRKRDESEGVADDEIDEATDISTLRAAEFTGPERTPPQPNAPRLFCILGDLESDSAVAHYERAWEISNHRYARAQKSLGEHYVAQKYWTKARDAYRLATSVNRLPPEMWSRLGDVNLRLGEFEEAAEAFTRAIGSSNDTAGGEDARTWSNLGSSLYSMYLETVEGEKNGCGINGDATNEVVRNGSNAEHDEDNDYQQPSTFVVKKDHSALLSRSMNAYKRGASIANDNWRIWDNVITLAVRIRPVPFFEIIQALRSIIRIKHSEDAVDDDILRLLLTEAVLPSEKKGDSAAGSGPYEPPRGSVERNVHELMEREVVPLITHRSELWELVSRLRVWRRDYVGAVEASEKAWRAAVGGATSRAGSMGGGLAVDAARGKDTPSTSWLEDKDAWTVVVQRTDELVAVLENFGPLTPEVGEKWRGKARNAIRSVMGKAREGWEGSEGWETLKGLLDGLKA